MKVLHMTWLSINFGTNFATTLFRYDKNRGDLSNFVLQDSAGNLILLVIASVVTKILPNCRGQIVKMNHNFHRKCHWHWYPEAWTVLVFIKKKKTFLNKNPKILEKKIFRKKCDVKGATNIKICGSSFHMLWNYLQKNCMAKNVAYFLIKSTKFKKINQQHYMQFKSNRFSYMYIVFDIIFMSYVANKYHCW